jgi:hypothetical protein
LEAKPGEEFILGPGEYDLEGPFEVPAGVSVIGSDGGKTTIRIPELLSDTDRGISLFGGAIQMHLARKKVWAVFPEPWEDGTVAMEASVEEGLSFRLTKTKRMETLPPGVVGATIKNLNFVHVERENV